MTERAPYNFIGWNETDDNGHDPETGRVGVMQVANAIQFWSIQQERPTSVAEASRTFRLPPGVVIGAVNSHPWMLLTGPDDDYAMLMIEHDGE